MRGKAAVERAFRVIRQLLFEHLTGYTGVDIADPEGDATLTMDEMEHLIATWIVGIFTDQKAKIIPLTAAMHSLHVSDVSCRISR